MIRLIAIAAFALTLATSARPCRLRHFISRTALVPKPVTAALPVATAGIDTMATAGIGATATAGIAATATAGTATGGIGPAMESSAAKCAGARYGVQGTFAASGIDTLGGGGLSGRPYLIWDQEGGMIGHRFRLIALDGTIGT